MSEKRFRANFDVSIYDSETEEYISASGNGLKEIAKRLNEQQTIIKYLTIEKHQADKRFQTIIAELKKENGKLRKENNDYEKQFRIINEKLDEYIKTADTYRIPISSLKYGDELGYFNGVYQYMKKLKKDIEELEDE